MQKTGLVRAFLGAPVPSRYHSQRLNQQHSTTASHAMGSAATIVQAPLKEASAEEADGQEN